MLNLAILQDACIVAAYMKRKFPNVLVSTLGLQGPNVEIEHPPGWSVEFALEVDLALDVIARAFHNQGDMQIIVGSNTWGPPAIEKT
ncbi:hypothetical protein BYT27DRAFT_7253962 [Phlegmacium glaucopus]|nr:hypothetical protein BYT27DRAFT_7253962 [Phlegmacium glaucopus]